MSEPEGKNSWMAVLVIAMAIVGFALAGVVVALPAAHASTASSGGAAASALTSGPLTAVKGSASGLSTAGPTVLGTVTVVPESQAFNPNAPDSATVTFTPSNSLSTLVNEINNVASPDYRHFLSAEALGDSYGSSDYASALAYFESYGLTVHPSATQLSVEVSGTVAQIEAAFHTSLSPFQEQYSSNGVWNPQFGASSGISGTTADGPTFYANTAPAELPQGLASAVSGITGLDGMVATPALSLPYGLSPGLHPAQTNGTGNNTTGTTPLCEFGVYGSCPQSLDGNQSIAASNFLWTNFGPDGYTCEDYELCGDFQFLFPSTMPDISGADSLWSGATTINAAPDTGQGITIAVIEVGCAIPSDLAQFSQMVYGNPNQLPDRVTQIAINTSGGYAATGLPNTNINNCELEGEFAGWTLETSLDIEYASTMAPSAHIDVIGIPYPGYFSDFDQAYSDITQFLALGSTGGVCASNATWQAAGMYVVEGGTAGACGVTITSNSYGEGEEYDYFAGSPMYITAEDQLLEALNAVGVTNFFASGDSGGVYETVNDFSAADSPGATAVGGAEITAYGDGSEFPVTSNSFLYCDGFLEGTTCYGATGTAYWSPAGGVGGTAYWSYGEHLSGTEQGVVGGGFGQSFVEPQAWWQNALDTYSSGAEVDPIIAGAAAFNMSVYTFGEWNLFYGGTSFATPISAGEWALVEEQANVAFGNPEMGDVNPLLFAAHNAYEAGTIATDPYTPMEDVTVGEDAAPVNSFTWYYYNLSIEVPSAPVQPLWFPSLGNPAGSGWNYLQGLGIMNAALIDQDLFGETGLAGHSLANPAFSLFLLTSGGRVPLTDPTLTAGTTYSFQVLNSNGQPGIYNVVAYSGQSSAGAYGGGTWVHLSTGSGGKFTYTPKTGTPPGGDSATTYGYFVVTSVVGPNPEWSFLDFAVAAPTPSGHLTLCVVDPYGNCDKGIAQTTMFTTTAVGDYNLFGQSEVYLNGLPVAGAMVNQVAIVDQYGELDPTLPPAYYAPGTTIGHTMSDQRGEATFWTDADVAENNGSLYTDVYELTASYDGLVSNTVWVYVEPQGGSFTTNDLSMNGVGTAIVGDLSFADMKYATFVNISVGGGAGQFVNYTCPLPGGASQPAHTVALPGCSPFEDTQFGYHTWESGVDGGTLPVHLNIAGLTGPIVVSVVADGANDVTFGYCETFAGETFCYADQALQTLIVWQDPVVFLPATISASLSSATVTGDDTIAWAGTAYPGAVGTLSLVSGAGSTVLATGVSGSYVLDTASYQDGAYSVVFTETAPGATSVSRTVTLYADNEASSLAATIATLNQQLAADQGFISWVQAQLNAPGASLSALESDMSTMQGQLASAQAQVAGLQSQLTSLQNSNAGDATLIASLQLQLSAAQANVASLESQVSQLQSELNSKHGSVAPAWYASFPGGGLGLAIVFATIGAVLGGLGVGLLARRRHGVDRGERNPAGNGTDASIAGVTESSALSLAAGDGGGRPGPTGAAAAPTAWRNGPTVLAAERAEPSRMYR
jgi:subtilase family serine protease